MQRILCVDKAYLKLVVDMHKFYVVFSYSFLKVFIAPLKFVVNINSCSSIWLFEKDGKNAHKQKSVEGHCKPLWLEPVLFYFRLNTACREKIRAGIKCKKMRNGKSLNSLKLLWHHRKNPFESSKEAAGVVVKL